MPSCRAMDGVGRRQVDREDDAKIAENLGSLSIYLLPSPLNTSSVSSPISTSTHTSAGPSLSPPRPSTFPTSGVYQPPTPTFLSLPPELRLQIYSLLPTPLSITHKAFPPINYTPLVGHAPSTKLLTHTLLIEADPSKPGSISPKLLLTLRLVCRHLHAEIRDCVIGPFPNTLPSKVLVASTLGQGPSNHSLNWPLRQYPQVFNPGVLPQTPPSEDKPPGSLNPRPKIFSRAHATLSSPSALSHFSKVRPNLLSHVQKMHVYGLDEALATGETERALRAMIWWRKGWGCLRRVEVFWGDVGDGGPREWEIGEDEDEENRGGRKSEEGEG